MQQIDKPLVGSREVARRIGMSRSWVRARAADGTLPHYLCGGNRMFDLGELLRLMRRDRQVGGRGQSAISQADR